MAFTTRTLAGRRDLLAPAALFPDRYPALLASAVTGTAQSRFDILFAGSTTSLSLDAQGVVRDGQGEVIAGPFLDAFDRAWASHHRARVDDGLPFHGGWVIYLAYELAAQVEPSLALPASRGAAPVAYAMRSPAAAIVDHVEGRTILMAEEGAEHWLDTLAADLETPVPSLALAAPERVEEDDPQRFLDGVHRIHEHLHAGDTFQVNLSRRWCAHFAEPPSAAALMLALRAANPAPFAGLLQQPGWAIVSSSPERLVEARDGLLQTRPIAGTRPRVPGDDDAARIRELTAHPKERAEHVMLIDLERNDLGRVCVPGSVKVDELMVVESYAHVHHIVSNVRGRAREGITPGQVVAATFPGGTITGCPKVRCMQIIGDIEQEPRGAYTGALGYIDDSGDMDLNILIRTLMAEGCEVSLRAGAGIVVDSIAGKELDETRAKARGLLRIFGAA
ncbi:aminodeoxychorismate synthase component I [Luteibacter aegosomatissinici]|uniref:aminodeoxychorismate synthase component I n=1 Tax=Luteibacter aegosomatissinici TaxID=2911539 RepID=UPI001FF904FA|nr:aminodeoxychorismate synthase component I [Luteibacter aegosomatissinici]UPG93094.1 aminodeoxychorismate synthase component I [Luteibacter aegosomatissinici]